jgi:hypothetical protein
MKTERHEIEVENIEDALNKIWHYGYEARPADPENTPHVKKLLFIPSPNEITMIVIEYDWEEGVPIPYGQWGDLDTIEHVYVYSWGDE